MKMPRAAPWSVTFAATRRMDGLKLADILFEWDEAGQNNVVIQAVSSNRLPLEDARQQQWRREFLNLGEVLKAYDYLASTGIVPIVKLDEFEKLPQISQAFFYHLWQLPRWLTLSRAR